MSGFGHELSHSCSSTDSHWRYSKRYAWPQYYWWKTCINLKTQCLGTLGSGSLPPSSPPPMCRSILAFLLMLWRLGTLMGCGGGRGERSYIQDPDIESTVSFQTNPSWSVESSGVWKLQAWDSVPKNLNFKWKCVYKICVASAENKLKLITLEFYYRNMIQEIWCVFLRLPRVNFK